SILSAAETSFWTLAFISPSFNSLPNPVNETTSKRCTQYIVVAVCAGRTKNDPLHDPRAGLLVVVVPANGGASIRFAAARPCFNRSGPCGAGCQRNPIYVVFASKYNSILCDVKFAQKNFRVDRIELQSSATAHSL